VRDQFGIIIMFEATVIMLSVAGVMHIVNSLQQDMFSAADEISTVKKSLKHSDDTLPTLLVKFELCFTVN